MSHPHFAYARSGDQTERPGAHAGDCIGKNCPCAVLAKRLTLTERGSLAVMVVGLLVFLVGVAEYLGAF